MKYDTQVNVLFCFVKRLAKSDKLKHDVVNGALLLQGDSLTNNMLFFDCFIEF